MVQITVKVGVILILLEDMSFVTGFALYEPFFHALS